MQFILYYSDFSTGDFQQEDDSTFAILQERLDSMTKTEKDSLRWKIYPFNPNFLTDFKAYQLGLSLEEADRLFEYRKLGKYVNSAAEFQGVTQANDSLMKSISPYFKFPEWTRIKKQAGTRANRQNMVKVKPITEIKDLNLVTAPELTQIKGVDKRLAKRIVSYRTKLKGFFYEAQLFEVYYLKKEVGKRILERYQILQQPHIDKTDINSASFKEILKIPYLDYELTKKIFEYRNENLGFSDLEELKKIDSFPLDKFDRITLYLSAQ
jgi:DNA uptake protein ComE-like DNA-binding protein